MIITGALKQLWISWEFCIKVEENGYSKDIAFICMGEKMVNIISQINVKRRNGVVYIVEVYRDTSCSKNGIINF